MCNLEKIVVIHPANLLQLTHLLYRHPYFYAIVQCTPFSLDFLNNWTKRKKNSIEENWYMFTFNLKTERNFVKKKEFFA